MLVSFLAAALAPEAPLALDLVCPGQYEDIEISTGLTSQVIGGDYVTGPTMIQTPVMRAGLAKLGFKGGAGEYVQADGPRRVLRNIVADPSHISADYEEKILLLPIRWRLDIDRLTGEIRVSRGGDVAFQGICSPVSTQPKF